MRGAIRSTLLPAIASLTFLASGAAWAALPRTLSCIEDAAVNWQAEAPALHESSAGDRGRNIIHLDPGSGEWHLQVEGAAALTIDGGTFDILRAGLEKPFDEWIGLDGDAMLRIHGSVLPLRFVAMSQNIGLVLGACTEPDEAFVFLRGPDPR